MSRNYPNNASCSKLILLLKYMYMKIKNKLMCLSCLLVLLTGCSSLNNSKEYSLDRYKLTMNYKSDFKIMQLTDLHFSVQTDYVKVKTYLAKNITTSNPDLMVLTGDTFMDATKNIVTNVLDFVDSFNIPFAITFGNHDQQGDYDYDFVTNYIKSKKNAMYLDYEDDNLTGLANYFIDLMDNGTVKYRLYILDSNSYYFNGIKYDYDIIHDEQLEHIENINKTDGDAFGLVFYHIPLYEETDAYALFKEGKIVGKGENREKSCVAYKRSDAFNRMKNASIKAHFFGHDHINYTDLMYQGVSLSYGLKSTPEIYSDDDLLGYKEITLKDDMSWDINTNIVTRFVEYEK